MVSLAVEEELRLSAFLSENNFCKINVISAKTQYIMTEKTYWFSQKYFYHAAFVELSLSEFFSENSFCKIDVISVQTGCIMTEKKLRVSQKMFVSFSICKI